jgi:hypothetical protein
MTFKFKTLEGIARVMGAKAGRGTNYKQLKH